ncbi:hypothetical protein Daus18300_003041 [Diaporthe australafricana]|uniref:Uncharacterized protein n=1 Tax=Diaporthe australafricana TaxID=127596 RepID=A0ABR3XJI7_9PEZI
MPVTPHNLPTPQDVAVCVELFTYLLVVFFLTRLSLDELGQEARQRGRVPHSGLLYLAAILLWPITVGIFAGLLLLGLLEFGLVVAYDRSARLVAPCYRRIITSCFPNRRRTDDIEMAILAPCCRDDRGDGEVEAEAEDSCLQDQALRRQGIAILMEECGLTPNKWK